MIINCPEGALSDEMQAKLNEEIEKRIKSKDEYAKQTLNFFEPARGDNKATIPNHPGLARFDLRAMWEEMYGQGTSSACNGITTSTTSHSASASGQLTWLMPGISRTGSNKTATLSHL